MDARRLLGHIQRGADLAVRAPVSEQRQHLALARREPERVFAGIRGGSARVPAKARRAPAAAAPAARSPRSPRRASSAPIAAAAASASAAASAAASRSPPASSASAGGAVACAARYGRPSASHAAAAAGHSAGSSCVLRARHLGPRAGQERGLDRPVALRARLDARDQALGHRDRERRVLAEVARAHGRVGLDAHAGRRHARHPRDVLRAEVEPVERVVDRGAGGVEIARCGARAPRAASPAGRSTAARACRRRRHAPGRAAPGRRRDRRGPARARSAAARR